MAVISQPPTSSCSSTARSFRPWARPGGWAAFIVIAWASVTLSAHGATAATELGPAEVVVDDNGCKRCDHQGVVPCSKHSKDLLEAEGRVLFCSVIAGCETCGGTLQMDCKHCDGGPGVAAVAARRAEIQAWMAASNEVEEHFGRPIPRCETPHLHLVMETGAKIKDGRKTVDPHWLMHQVADDCEHVAVAVTEHFKVEGDGDLPAKMRMWFWSKGKDHLSAVQAFMGIAAQGDFKMLGKDPVFSVWQQPGLFTTAPAIRSLFAHNIAHMLLSNLEAERDISILGGGWFDAGLGHWYEYDRFQRSTHYCTEEASAQGQFANGVWKAAMRKLVEGTESSLFVPVVTLSTTTMTAQQQAICWSFFDWLVANHVASLRPILDGLKVQRETRELFKEHLGMSVLAAEQAWRQWVSETYPKKEKPTRRRR